MIKKITEELFFTVSYLKFLITRIMDRFSYISIKSKIESGWKSSLQKLFYPIFRHFTISLKSLLNIPANTFHLQWYLLSISNETDSLWYVFPKNEFTTLQNLVFSSTILISNLARYDLFEFRKSISPSGHLLSSGNSKKNVRTVQN